MKRALSLLLALSMALTLSGCGFVLSRSYSSVTPYEEQRREETDHSILRAENYTELLNSVQYFVTQGVTEGVVRLYQYQGDVERDLYAACQEILLDDPVGTYALEEISGEFTHIVTYYECTIHYSYRRTEEQIAAIRRVNGTAAIRSAIAEAFRSRETELALELSAYFAKEETLRWLANEAYCENPAFAVEYPELQITIYPSTGSSRVVELSFGWTLTAEELHQRVEEVRQASAALIGAAGVNGRANLARLCTLLSDQVEYDPSGKQSVYAALNGEAADSLGVALAFQLVCSLSDITSQVVFGQRDGAPHWWNIITTQEGSFHVDLTEAPPEGSFFRYDGEMSGRYVWDTAAYPACPEPEEASNEGESGD